MHGLFWWRATANCRDPPDGAREEAISISVAACARVMRLDVRRPWFEGRQVGPANGEWRHVPASARSTAALAGLAGTGVSKVFF